MQIGVILDASGSMEPSRERTIDGLNAYLNGLRGDVKTCSATFSLMSFNTSIGHTALVTNMMVTTVPSLLSSQYICTGMTPLYDAVGTMLHQMDRQIRDDEPVIFVVITDGLENASSEFTLQKVAQMIKERQDKGNWTFIFMGADIDAWGSPDRQGMGVSHGNTMSYDKVETVNTMRSMAADTVRFAASGQMSTRNFHQTPKTVDQGRFTPGKGRVLNAKEVAERLGVSPSTFARMKKEGNVPKWSTISRRASWEAADVESWIEQTKNRA